MDQSAPEWISAAANVVLALSVIGTAWVALNRWTVLFYVISEGRSFGQSTIEGVAQPPYFSWDCKLHLLAGPAAHIENIWLEGRRFGVWQRVKDGAQPRRKMPVSLTEGEDIELFIFVDQSDDGPHRIVIQQYGTGRKVRIPFLPSRARDAGDYQTDC